MAHRRETLNTKGLNTSMTQRDGLSSQEPMAPSERRAALSLATLFFFRMFGLFLILPVLALHAQQLAGATPFLIGVAMGVYGLTQALFQIPFGGFSDRYGRKPVIAAGLLIFGLGSVLCALSGHVAGIIAGRALQGSGAISAAVMALAADLTREEQRIKVMAVIGVTIGLAFAAAFVAGPALDAVIGLHGLFWLAAGLALGGLAVLYLFVPEPAHSAFHRECESQWGQVLGILATRDLRRLNVGIGCLHFLLTASFVVLPVVLRDDLGLASPSHWQVYLPVFGLSIVLMVPAIRAAQRRGREVFLGAVALVGVSELGLALGHGSASWRIPHAVGLLFGVQLPGGEPSGPGLADGAGRSARYRARRLRHVAVPRDLRGGGDRRPALGLFWRHRRVPDVRRAGVLLVRVRPRNGAAAAGAQPCRQGRPAHRRRGHGAHRQARGRCGSERSRGGR